jgi:hypothetical protein
MKYDMKGKTKCRSKLQLQKQARENGQKEWKRKSS